MIVLVPLARFRVRYEVATGRPFSGFERLILAAVARGATRLEELGETFAVPARLLVEGLLTLTHAGWLAEGAEGFVLTSEGKVAADSGQSSSVVEVSSKVAYVVMERTTGAVVANSEVVFASKRDFGERWEDAVRLAPDAGQQRLDEGQVQHLLPRRPGEWVRWVDSIELVSRDAYWLPVNVDITGGSVVGLPAAWAFQLRHQVVGEARRRAASRSPAAQRATWDIPEPSRTGADGEKSRPLHGGRREWSVGPDEIDLAIGTEAHEGIARSVLREADVVLIASPVSGRGLDFMAAPLEEALRRGATIDLLWGGVDLASDQTSHVLDRLRQLAFDARTAGAGGRLSFNDVPSQSNARALIWRAGNDYGACVGSYDWLAAHGDRPAVVCDGISVTVVAPRAVAAVTRCICAFWAAMDSTLASAPDRWRRVAAELEAESSRDGDGDGRERGVTLRIVLDGEHEELLGQWSTEQGRLAVSCDRVGSKASATVSTHSAWQSRDPGIQVFYSRLEGAAALDEVEESLSRLGAVVSHQPNQRGRFLATDRSVCVTSYDFLRAPVAGARPVRDLGVAIDSVKAATRAWEWLAQDLSDPS